MRLVDPLELPGTFYIRQTPEKMLAGVLELAPDTAPRIRFDTGALIPMVSWVTQPDGSVVGHGIDLSTAPRVAICGKLADGRFVQLSSAYASQTQGGLLALEESQTVTGLSVLIGDSLLDPSDRFVAARISVTELDSWASLSEDGDRVEAPLAGGDSVSIEQSGGEDFFPEYATVINLSRPLTEYEVDRRYVRPLTNLVTLATQAEAQLIDYQLQSERTRSWYWSVSSATTRPASSRQISVAKLLLYFSDLGTTGIARWLGAVHRLGPLPTVLATDITATSYFIEARTLNLTVLLEGLHTAMRSPQMLEDRRIDRLRSAMRQSVRRIDKGALARVDGLLSPLGKPSYKERARDLVSSTAPLLDGIVGNPEVWLKSLGKARNTIAHAQFDGPLSDQDVSEMTWICFSVQWMLIVALFLEIDVPTETVSVRLSNNQSYLLRCRQSKYLWMPRAFAPATYRSPALESVRRRSRVLRPPVHHPRRTGSPS